MAWKSSESFTNGWISSGICNCILQLSEICHFNDTACHPKRRQWHYSSAFAEVFDGRVRINVFYDRLIQKELFCVSSKPPLYLYSTRLFDYSMISAFEYFSCTISFISVLCSSFILFPKHTTFTEFEGNANTRSWVVNAFPLPILKNLYSSSNAHFWLFESSCFSIFILSESFMKSIDGIPFTYWTSPPPLQ